MLEKRFLLGLCIFYTGTSYTWKWNYLWSFLFAYELERLNCKYPPSIWEHVEWCDSSSQVTVILMEPFFSGDGWTPGCPWEGVNEFLDLLCLCTWLLLYLLNCHYLNSQVLSLLSFWFSPPSWHRRCGEWASGCVRPSCWLGLNHDSPFGLFISICAFIF